MPRHGDSSSLRVRVPPLAGPAKSLWPGHASTGQAWGRGSAWLETLLRFVSVRGGGFGGHSPGAGAGRRRTLRPAWPVRHESGPAPGRRGWVSEAPWQGCRGLALPWMAGIRCAARAGPGPSSSSDITAAARNSAVSPRLSSSNQTQPDSPGH